MLLCFARIWLVRSLLCTYCFGQSAHLYCVSFEWLRRCDLYSVLDIKCFWHWAQLKLGVPCSRFIWSTIPWLDLYCLPQTWHTYFADESFRFGVLFACGVVRYRSNPSIAATLCSVWSVVWIASAMWWKQKRSNSTPQHEATFHRGHHPHSVDLICFDKHDVGK